MELFNLVMNWIQSNLDWAIVNFNKLETKDKITTTTSIFAITIAFISAILSVISFKQKAREGSYALRKQLSDTMQKLLEINTEFAKRDLEPEKYPKHYGGLLNDQRRFHARIALSLLRPLRRLVSRWEILVIARAFGDLSDYETAKKLYLFATRRSASSVEDATVLRSYGRFLFQSGETDQARETMQKAIDRLTPKENVAHERGYTYENWAHHEWQFGSRSTVLELFDQAIEEFQNDGWPQRSEHAIHRIMSSDVRADAALHAEMKEVLPPSGERTPIKNP